MKENIQAKNYMNVEVLYNTSLKRQSAIKNNAIFIGILMLFLIWAVTVTVLIVYVFPYINMIADAIIRDYAVGILDRVFVRLCEIFVFVVVAITLLRLLVCVINKTDSVQDETIYSFFVNQKYMKFYWRDNKLVCCHENKRGQSGNTELGELERGLKTKFQIYYDDSHGKMRKLERKQNDLSNETLWAIIHLNTTPLKVTVDLQDEHNPKLVLVKS